MWCIYSACYFLQSDIWTPAPKDPTMAEQSVRDGGEQQQDAGENPAWTAGVSAETCTAGSQTPGTGRSHRTSQERLHSPWTRRKAAWRSLIIWILRLTSRVCVIVGNRPISDSEIKAVWKNLIHVYIFSASTFKNYVRGNICRFSVKV